MIKRGSMPPFFISRNMKSLRERKKERKKERKGEKSGTKKKNGTFE
jgi:hypothetical protein|tara:strand:- start:2688 stop:2825 length:138 start_codon:yes stop_codon:yes gene_type:complete